jgi:hypothetical protein
VHWFASAEDAKQKIDAFRWDYNEIPLTELSRAYALEYGQRAMITAANSPS